MTCVIDVKIIINEWADAEKKPRKDSKPKCEQPWQDKNALHLYGREQKAYQNALNNI